MLLAVRIFDDLEAECDRLEAILECLDATRWRARSDASGWTVADVVLHLAQGEEAVVAAVEGTYSPLLAGGTAVPAGDAVPAGAGAGAAVDGTMDEWVRRERAAPDIVFGRWRTARRVALAALRRADPDRRLPWVAAPLKPTMLATTRLAEHWTHGLDVTVPFAIPFPDTVRLRHIAWLGHRTLPYAFTVAGGEPHEVFCELTGPDGSIWRYGSPEAASTVTGSAGAFCRVGARRLAPADSGLVTRGPHGALALRVLRNYAA